MHFFKHLAAVSVIFMSASCALADPEIVYLGEMLGTDDTRGWAMNSDGSVVVGDTRTSNYPDAAIIRAFLWSAATGVVDLGLLPGTTQSTAWSVSEDGSVVVGWCESPMGSVGFRWTPDRGIHELSAPDGWLASIAYGVSDDGRTIVGLISDGEQAVGCRWVEDGEAEPLPPLEAGGTNRAYAISANGDLVAGTASFEDEGRMYLWSENTGMKDLGTRTAGEDTRPVAMSANGSAIVGYWGGLRAFLWRNEDGWHDLEAQHFLLFPYATTATGTAVVGSSFSLLTSPDPWYWREDLGFVFLHSQTNFLGLQIGSPAVFSESGSISPDGTIMLVSGYYQGDSGIFLIRGLPRVDGLCMPDFTGDGTLDVFDVQEFLDRYATGSADADFVRDGVLDFFDLQAFLNAFAAGCGG